VKRLFEIGSKITIRTDLKTGMSIKFGVNEEMEKLAGKESKILDIDGGVYRLEIDNKEFSWNISMFTEFQLILEKHKKWLNNDSEGERANLSDADLSDADLSDADLSDADLSDADLSDAENVQYPIVCPERGSFIGFKKAKSEDFDPVIVELLILEDAKRSSATTRKCRCSKTKVLSITSLDEKENYNKAMSNYAINFIYEVGKIVEVDDFDENRWNECSAGIHFFITRQEAVDY